MQTNNNIMGTSVVHHSETQYGSRLTDKTIAELLGISLDDYRMLVHLPLEALVDNVGAVIAFCLRFSTNNNKRLLEKLNIDKSYTVTFRPEQIYRLS